MAESEAVLSKMAICENEESDKAVWLIPPWLPNVVRSLIGKGSLCDRCKALKLDIDSFIIPRTATPRSVQQSQYYAPRKADKNFSRRSGTSLRNFATLQELQTNRGSCAFCRLLIRTIEQYSGRQHVNETESCSLRWELHGRTIGTGSHILNCTRRIRLTWIEKAGYTQDIYLILVAQEDHLQRPSDATAKSTQMANGLGRELGHQKENHALIKSWLDHCIIEHNGECCNSHGADNEFEELIEETYFGVIDVVDMQLKSLPRGDNDKPEPFIALSYVWGQKSHDKPLYVTSRLNIMDRITHGGLRTAWDQLPRTIQDAITLVGRLGYRYLWVDSLCIVQDSQSSWQLNAQKMHLIYGNALFTICAADGHDSSAGLPAADSLTSQQISEEIKSGLRIMVTRPFEVTINDSEWNKRGWTFQERVSSPADALSLPRAASTFSVEPRTSLRTCIQIVALQLPRRSMLTHRFGLSAISNNVRCGSTLLTSACIQQGS
jgi:hypothetical protein